MHADEKGQTNAGKGRLTSPQFRHVQKLDLVGTAEAAKILDVERPRIAKWRRLGLLPEPVAEVASGPIWLRSQIEEAIGVRELRRRPARQASARPTP